MRVESVWYGGHGVIIHPLTVHYMQYIPATRKPWLSMGMGTFVLDAYILLTVISPKTVCTVFTCIRHVKEEKNRP
jgi:hypothetical protein